jgi:acetyl esterase/lipase
LLIKRKCTGAGDFPAWYSQTTISRAKAKKVIIIAPDYPLGPEGNYKDIVDCLSDFLVWYKEDGCFEPGFTKWTEWLYKQKPVQNFTIDKNHVYVEGESAGGQAAVTALWLNATKGGPNLPIDVALLRYPMIAHYKRKWDKIADKDGKVNYMGVCFTKKDVLQREANITDLTKWLESHSLVPTCSSRWPSVGMAFAFILSVTERWQWYFQRQHSLPKAKRDELDYMDGIERANNTQASVLHQLLPPIYIFHGWNDPNCPIDNTQEFVRVLETKYPERYNNDKNLRFDIVKKLAVRKSGNPDGSINNEYNSDNVGHGFDYWLNETEEEFLRDAYDWVGDRWKTSS